jgi:hypothetical protein
VIPDLLIAAGFGLAGAVQHAVTERFLCRPLAMRIETRVAVREMEHRAQLRAAWRASVKRRQRDAETAWWLWDQNAKRQRARKELETAA